MFDEHESGQLRIGAQGDALELLPLADEAIPAAGHVETPAELEAARRAELAGMPATWIEYRSSLSRSEELTGEAFKACALARGLVDAGALEVSAEVAELLERERHYGRAIDAHEAARALRAAGSAVTVPSDEKEG